MNTDCSERTTFDSLPADILLSILDFSNRPTLCVLRLISQRFNGLICRILFSTHKLDFYSSSHGRPNRLTSDIENLKALATRTTKAFDGTRTLIFEPGKPFKGHPWTVDQQVQDARRVLRENTALALSSLENVREVRWSAKLTELPPDFVEGFFLGISMMKNLEELRLSWYSENGIFALKPLVNLRTLFVSFQGLRKSDALGGLVSTLLPFCPSIEDLQVQDTRQIPNGRASPTTVGSLFSGALEQETPLRLKALHLTGVVITPDDIRRIIKYLRDLKILRMGVIPVLPLPHQAFSAMPVLEILMQESIHLKELSFEEIGFSLPVSPYLYSYSGLKSLYVEQKRDESHLLFNKLPDILFRHSPFLESLTLSFAHPLQQPYQGILDAFHECSSLRFLRVYINLRGEDTESERHWKVENWLEAASHIPNLAKLRVSIRFKIKRDEHSAIIPTDDQNIPLERPVEKFAQKSRFNVRQDIALIA